MSKLFFVTAFLVCALTGYSQIQVQPGQRTDLRLASWHMEQAADLEELAAWIGGIGMAFVASDRLNNPGSSMDFSAGVLAVTATAYVGINLVSTKHTRKAAAALY